MSLLKSKPFLILACAFAVSAGAWLSKSSLGSTGASADCMVGSSVNSHDDHSRCGAHCKHHHHKADRVRQEFEKSNGDAISKRFPQAKSSDLWKGLTMEKPLFQREALLAKKGDKVSLHLGSDQPLEGVLTGRQLRKDGAQVFGMTVPGTEFRVQYIEMTDGSVVGAIRQPQQLVSYRLSGTIQQPVITAIAAVDDYCSEWSESDAGIVQGLPRATTNPGQRAPVSGVAKLDSNLDSPNVIYLDFDGEDITGSGSGWGDIVAEPSTFTADEIQLIWDAVAEDFRSFDVNVTTDRTVFDDAPVGQRMMVIFTPTDDAAPGAGGVAFLGSFYNNSDEPCWVFNGGVSAAALAASHEVGHTVDLVHDGRISPAEEYYEGNATWGPIMGAPYSSRVTHWSRGEYVSANNQEDDISIISESLPLLPDSVGDDPLNAQVLSTDQDGNLSLNGSIETQNDVDYYSFETSGGLITFNAVPTGPTTGINGQNLNIRLRITDSGGGTVIDSNDEGSMPTSISANLVGGSYFLLVEGAGEGSWATGGFGDYGSIGSFSITGNLPLPSPGDFDGDGLTDDEELALGTKPNDRDSDGDGLSDRQEVYPFSIVSELFSFDAALADAVDRGGNLTVIDSPKKLYDVKRGLLSTPLPNPLPNNYDPEVELQNRLWLGGHDSLTDGRFQWVTAASELNGTEIGSAVLGYVVPGSTSISNLVNANALTVGRRIYGAGLPTNVTITGLDTTARSLSLSAPVNAALSQGIASVVIQNPGTRYFSVPTVNFTPAGATATATVDSGRITSVAINNPGVYTAPPAISFTGTTGGGAAVTAVLTPAATLSRVYEIDVTSGGSGYTSPPTVVIAGVGTGATAVANLNAGVVTDITVINPGLGYTEPPVVTLVGGDGTGATAVARIVDPAMRLYSPATPSTYSRWTGGLLPGNRLNVAEGIAVNSGTEFLWSATQATTSLGYVLERPKTNPLSRDSDSDGIDDLVELNEYGTNPTLADSDSDGINDSQEIFVHLTNPKLVDTDGDGLTDGQEVNGTIGGFKSNPLIIDSDGDLVSDIDEVNATPPTDPLDGSSFPSGATTIAGSGLQNTVTFLGEQTVSVDQTFAPFGHRPDTDKSGDDGSVAIRDRNGAIIWVDSTGNATVIPDSSLARTLYVSNTECVMYNNRYDGTFDARDSTSTVVIHRRAADGTLNTSEPIEIDGTIVDTAPISPTTFGFTLVAGRSFDDGFAESTQRFQSGVTADGLPIFDIENINYWDVCNYTMYRITWDAQLQVLGATQLDVAPGAPNLGTTRVIGSGSDGSFVFNRSVAQNFFRNLPTGGFFNAETASYWVSFNLNSENIRRVSNRFEPEVENIGYVSNVRALLEFPITTLSPETDANLNPIYLETGNYELQDLRQRPNGVTNTVNTFALDLGDKLLPVTTYTRAGMIPYIYTIGANRTAVKLYRVDAALVRLGATVNLPDQVLDDAAAIRNAWDASLLVKSEGSSGLLWLPSIINATTKRVDGLSPARSLTNSTQALPMFVDTLQSVAWMNSDAPVDLTLGAQVPLAVINHFQKGTGNFVIVTPLTPPIEGRYVALPPSLSPDPDSEGWFTTTFEKTGDRSSRIRKYRIGRGTAADRDLDGVPDSIEVAFGTDPANPDSDDDGINDGDEITPYYTIDGDFTWQEASADAVARGGRLAVFGNRDQYLAAVFRFKNRNIATRWIGATDSVTESSWLWLDGTAFTNAQWLQPGAQSWSGFYNLPGGQSRPWASGMPNNLGNADGLSIRSDMLFQDRPVLNTYGYLIEYPRTNPLNPDTDGDGILDGDEFLNGTNPVAADPFSGVPTVPVFPPGGPFINFSNSGVAGNYEGLVFDPAQGHTHRQTLSVSTRGGFSSSLTGLEAGIRGTLRGSFSSVGYHIGAVPKTLRGLVSIELWLAEDPLLPGQWMVRGRCLTNTGSLLGVELRRSKYSSRNRYATPGRLTMIMPMADQENPGPKGDAVAVGSINSSGVVALSMYHPDGGRSSFSGSILHGEVAALRSLSSSRSAPSVVLGPLNMNDPATDRDFGGMLRYYSPEAVPGSQFQEGFSQIRTVSGARYAAPPRGVLALRGFNTSQFNSQFNLEGGDFNGLSSIGTWSVSNSIVIPPSPAQRATATFAAATGLLTYRYTGTDADRGLVNAPASGFAVHQQLASVGRGSAVVRGYYTSAFSNGGLSVTPNDGSIPDITVISPVNQKLFNGAGATQTYTIDVRTQGAWQVVVPAGLNWATVAVVGADAATPLVGNGNGTVTITVGSNETTAQRVLRINIAGVTHTLTQDYRSF